MPIQFQHFAVVTAEDTGEFYFFGIDIDGHMWYAKWCPRTDFCIGWSRAGPEPCVIVRPPITTP